MCVLCFAEKFTQLQIASFEVQFQTLYLLGSHRQRGELLMKMKSVVMSSLKTLEEMEIEIVEALQNFKTEELEETTEKMNMLNLAHTQFPQDPVLSHISEVVKNNHPHIVSSLGKEEEDKTKEITQRFLEMKKNLNHLLSRIDDL